MPKIMVMYPYPADVDKFDRDYTEDHAPMVSSDTFPKITKFVANKVAGTPDGRQPKYRLIAELHFASMEDLQAAASNDSAQKAVAHAFEISSGGPPEILICEEDAKTF